MLKYLLNYVIISLIAGCLACPALGDDVVIEKGDGPVKITIRNTKPKPPSSAPKATGSPQQSTGTANAAPLDQQTTIKIIEEVLAKYSANNKYSELTETQCKQMSEAIWYRLRVKGIDVRLAAGNVGRRITGLGFALYASLANHAWVMAKTPEKGWLALECTNGSIVERKENDLYYTGGVFFATPEAVYRFDGLRRNIINSAKRYETLAAKWNKTYADRRIKPGSELAQRADAEKKTVLKIHEQLNKHVANLESLYNSAQAIK
ncbi:hypothetical protein [Desulfovibrio ferrophilus]|uniref:Transglutaminase family protein n=1 Tax=Desulfovibrio ferrophilus TaxID=241368 RepID=A0A2Z6B1Q9_9BACT|nr:hypothetical protein [Desulfovibrio ferrophilus]BBD09457.1 transglutaminase family protein [Desulfovibrio ferrophilus]